MSDKQQFSNARILARHLKKILWTIVKSVKSTFNLMTPSKIFKVLFDLQLCGSEKSLMWLLLQSVFISNKWSSSHITKLLLIKTKVIDNLTSISICHSTYFCLKDLMKLITCEQNAMISVRNWIKPPKLYTNNYLPFLKVSYKDKALVDIFLCQNSSD